MPVIFLAWKKPEKNKANSFFDDEADKSFHPAEIKISIRVLKHGYGEGESHCAFIAKSPYQK